VNDFLVLLSSVAVIIGFLGALIGLYNSFHVRKNTNEIQQIAVNVNGNITALVGRIAQLTEIMNNHGVPVPPPTIPIPETGEAQ
jgi:hypothetical protein